LRPDPLDVMVGHGFEDLSKGSSCVTSTSTADTDGARDHARSQAGRSAASMPTVPATGAVDLPEGVAADDVVWDEAVAGGGYTHRRLARGTMVRLVDLDGDACANVVLHNAVEPAERLNVADTVKVQWQAYLGTGSLLLSDQGRVLASIVDDSSGAHDALCGSSTRRHNEQRYGDGSPHGPSPSARELFLLALAKHGLGTRDLPPTISFFKGTRVDADGGLTFVEGAGAGSSVTLRVELPLIFSIANTVHVLDPRPDYVVTRVRVTAWKGQATGRSDRAWSATPEGERAFLNVEEYMRSVAPAQVTP
jgi:urea carboxylase-associated protein 2